MKVNIYIEDEIKDICDLKKFSVNLFIKDRNLFLKLAKEAKEEVFEDSIGEYFKIVYCKVDKLAILENGVLKLKDMYNT